MHHAQATRKSKLLAVQLWLKELSKDEVIERCMELWSCTRRKAREYIRDVS